MFDSVWQYSNFLNAYRNQKMFPKSIAFAAIALFAPACVSAQTTTAELVEAPTIDSVINQMTTASEAIVIDPRYEWHQRASVIQYSPAAAALPAWWAGNRPDWCYTALTWFTAYEAQGNAAVNSRVQLRNLRMYVLSNKTRTWTSVDVMPTPYTELWKYPFVYAGGSTAAGLKTETSGGISVKPVYPQFHHGYGNKRTILDPTDVRAVYVAMDYRLVVDNPALPDDRAKARYVINAGADYYPGLGRTWGVNYAPGIGGGKFMLATNTWRTAAMLVPNKLLGSNFTELRVNVPPLAMAAN